MAIVGIERDVAVKGRKRRGDYGHSLERRRESTLTMAVTGESGTFLQAGWSDGENWKTKVGGLSDLSNRGCSSITILCW